MKKLCDYAISLLEAGESFVQATILASSGSVPRGTGACMLIMRDGKIFGTVGGGALEAGMIKAAPEAFKSKQSQLIHMVLDGNDAVAAGMICGGRATALIDYIDPNAPGNLEFFKAFKQVLTAGVPALIATAPPCGNPSVTRFQCILTGDGQLLGTEGFAPELTKALMLGGKELSAMSEDGKLYLRRIGEDGTVYIFGGGHCGEKLAHILHTVGFYTVVIDDREEFANREKFPDADEILIPESMDMPFSQFKCGENSYIVIVTRGHKFDELVLRCALRTNAGYIGMIGSAKKRDSIYGNLLSDGYSQSDIDRVTAPIGLPIGDETPEEIAISIAAQLILVRSEKRNSAVV